LARAGTAASALRRLWPAAAAAALALGLAVQGWQLWQLEEQRSHDVARLEAAARRVSAAAPTGGDGSGSPEAARASAEGHAQEAAQSLHRLAAMVLALLALHAHGVWRNARRAPLPHSDPPSSAPAPGLLPAGAAAQGPPSPPPSPPSPPSPPPPPPSPPPDAVAGRLLRAIDHAQRHAGFGFALLAFGIEPGAGEGRAELLCELEARLLHTLRPGDALARREDGFLALLEGVADAATLAPIAERVLAELAEPCVVGCIPVLAGVRLGAVLHTGTGAPHGAGAAEALRQQADTALAEARRRGGGWQLFDTAWQARTQQAQVLAGELRQGLAEGGLFVVYQPVVQLSTRTLVGVEALLRWRHPQRGLVAPPEFIAAAEECGLIDEVGAFVLDRACAQFALWRRTLGWASPRQLAVNLSRVQLLRPGLVRAVQQALQAHGLRAEQLQLEVPEALVADDGGVQATLGEVKALGVRLALDGFGTGSSSLACLHRMPLDAVKLDRSVVQRAATVEHHRVLIEATARVARMLGIATVAEGVETAEQAALMSALDCERGQGHLYCQALEAPALETWLRSHAAGRVAYTV
jgi:EAL domain-containing protein (putative c-di-GMP-specific phosphodiesterase class I)